VYVRCIVLFDKMFTFSACYWQVSTRFTSISAWSLEHFVNCQRIKMCQLYCVINCCVSLLRIRTVFYTLPEKDFIYVVVQSY